MSNQTKSLFSGQSGSNPFGNLAEVEPASSPEPNRQGLSNPFAQALAEVGGKTIDANPEQFPQTDKPQNWEAPKADPFAERQQVFRMKEAQTREKLLQTRQELQSLINQSGEKKNSLRHVEIQVSQNIAEPGESGVGALAYFSVVRRTIKLNTRRAQSWQQIKENQVQKAKQKRQTGAGIDMGTGGSETAKAVHDITDNNELNSAYSGS